MAKYVSPFVLDDLAKQATAQPDGPDYPDGGVENAGRFDDPLSKYDRLDNPSLSSDEVDAERYLQQATRAPVDGTPLAAGPAQGALNCFDSRARAVKPKEARQGMSWAQHTLQMQGQIARALSIPAHTMDKIKAKAEFGPYHNFLIDIHNAAQPDPDESEIESICPVAPLDIDARIVRMLEQEPHVIEVHEPGEVEPLEEYAFDEWLSKYAANSFHGHGFDRAEMSEYIKEMVGEGYSIRAWA